MTVDTCGRLLGTDGVDGLVLGLTGGFKSDSSLGSVVVSNSSVVKPIVGLGFEVVSMSSKRVMSSNPGLEGREVVLICG